MYINMLSDYLKSIYNTKIYKLILSGGMTCPNRDGSCGTKGCIFCSSGGSGEFSAHKSLSVNEQIESQKSLLQNKTKTDKYIAYFQAFSNTYASVDYLRNLYLPIINRNDICILSIATRPDCIDDDILALLSELNKIKPVWIELGLQTIKDNTAKYIRRGYETKVYFDTVSRLKSIGVNVITHLILGLPNESKDDMIMSTKLVGEVSDGIKFHMLYVLRDTDLENEYTNNKIKLLSKEEYIDILCDCIRVIPKNVVIHRITGDAPKDALITPKWSSDKVKVLREIHNAFYDKNVVQGEFLQNR